MIKTIKVSTKRGIKTVTVIIPAKGNANVIIQDYLKNKFARIDPNFKVIG